MIEPGGYQHHPDAECPYCGGNYGMIEATDEPGVFRYRCWCGATATVTDD